ncbi:MAG TPA: zinc-dependent metalloprotease [Gemmatimonadaceae bacterium]|nr:zinc-dependent metalloprotease [Gemmatimonadaceae bacterium]
MRHVLVLALAHTIITACATAGSSPPRTSPQSGAQSADARPDTTARSIATRTAGMEKREGFLATYLDGKQGKIFIELPRDTMRMLFFAMTATGLGSNPIGIDRGADGPSQVLRFVRSGNQVLAVFENWNYRSSATNNPAHVRSVAESFPSSTVAALPLVAEEGGRLLIDVTDFVIRDWMEVAATLQRQNEGSYELARDRSSIVSSGTKSFPTNTEIDVALTFATRGQPGSTLAAILPDGRSFTIRQHITLLQLPDSAYRPRVLDPRTGYFGITFKDYAQPLSGSLEQRWIARHRLERVDPRDPSSPIKKPIVFYIDRGIPEPIRSATRAGAQFWVEAFDQAGLKGGFRVEDLPEDADPMDARYNVVQWINRNERGWSIGGSMSDPRTGELLKGMARMDSHRARTSYNLVTGLMGVTSTPAETAFVLGRVRQVTAHEIGHTLGMAHNYIASTAERSSVMDYPPPRVRLDSNGNIDVSTAYDVGPGEYDVWAVRWGYGIFPPESETDSLRALIAEGLRKRFLFLSDADARPDFASDPRTNLWDDAESPTAFLKHQMDVRRVAISRFGERNIAPGEPLALLQERFVPVYLFHRFALNSVAKTIGGMEYHNAMRGDGLQATRPVPGAEQRRALGMLVAALRPEELAIPDTVISLLAPRPFSYGNTVELFGSRTRPAFDELGAARTLAQMVVDAVLQRDRAARLVQFAARDASALTLSETIDSLVSATWRRAAPRDAKMAALQRVTQRALADRLLTLAADSAASPEVRAVVDLSISRLRDEARRRSSSGAEMGRAHWAAISGDFTRWIERRELPAPTGALRAPPGDPFGEDPE